MCPVDHILRSKLVANINNIIIFLTNKSKFFFFSFRHLPKPDSHTIPGNRGAVSNFDKLNYDLSKEIKKIVEEDLPKLTTNRIYRNLNDFWMVCNNESK